MIRIGDRSFGWDDPLVLGVGGALVAILFLLLILRAAGRAARMVEPMLNELGWLGQQVQMLSDGQERLAGGLHHVSEAQASTQGAMLQLMERRLAEVQRGMAESLHGTSLRTARSLGDLHQRLETIDRAQANIEKLSGDVLGLQDILSNKQTRGAFGEIQLHDIVQKALPSDSYTMQATLSNGKRADCLIHLPEPPGPIVIDSKFPLEAYEALRAAENPAAQMEAQRMMRVALRAHIRAISEKYILEGETADGAMLFLPSEGGLCRASCEFRRHRARGLCGAGLDRLAHHLHGGAEHDAGGAEGRADAGAGRSHPPRTGRARARDRPADGPGGQSRPPLHPGGARRRGDPHLGRQGGQEGAASGQFRLRGDEPAHRRGRVMPLSFALRE